LKAWRDTQIYEYAWLQFTPEEDQKWRTAARHHLAQKQFGRDKKRLSEEEVNEIIDSIKPTYQEDNVLEYHVDDCDYFQELALSMYPVMGGNTSIRKPPTDFTKRETWPIITIGEDEAVFKSGCFRKSVWIVDGTRPLFPKSEGQGLHVAAFHSR